MASDGLEQSKVTIACTEYRVLIFFENGAAQRTLVFRFLTVELAVAFKFELDVEILVDGELRRKFSPFLAFESVKRSYVTFGK